MSCAAKREAGFRPIKPSAAHGWLCRRLIDILAPWTQSFRWRPPWELWMTSDCRLSQQCPEGTHPVRERGRVCAATVRVGWGDHRNNDWRDPGLPWLGRPSTALVFCQALKRRVFSASLRCVTSVR